MVFHACNMMVGSPGTRVTFAGGTVVQVVSLKDGTVWSEATCAVPFHMRFTCGFAFRTVKP